MIIRTMSRVILFFFLLTTAMAASLVSATPSREDEEQQYLPTGNGSPDEVLPFYDAPKSMRGLNYGFSRYDPRVFQTCAKFPKICQWRGSPGPDCCGMLCVNLMFDLFNCGECGKMCRFGQICCSGKCVNVMLDPNNCGACKRTCKKGGFCSFGMCNYA